MTEPKMVKGTSTKELEQEKRPSWWQRRVEDLYLRVRYYLSRYLRIHGFKDDVYFQTEHVWEGKTTWEDVSFATADGKMFRWAFVARSLEGEIGDLLTRDAVECEDTVTSIVPTVNIKQPTFAWYDLAKALLVYCEQQKITGCVYLDQVQIGHVYQSYTHSLWMLKKVKGEDGKVKYWTEPEESLQRRKKNREKDRQTILTQIKLAKQISAQIVRCPQMKLRDGK